MDIWFQFENNYWTGFTILKEFKRKEQFQDIRVLKLCINIIYIKEVKSGQLFTVKLLINNIYCFFLTLNVFEHLVKNI